MLKNKQVARITITPNLQLSIMSDHRLSSGSLVNNHDVAKEGRGEVTLWKDQQQTTFYVYKQQHMCIYSLLNQENKVNFSLNFFWLPHISPCY